MTQTKFKGVKLTLGDRTFVCPPLSLRALQALQERLRAYQGGAALAADVSIVADAAYAALIRNYPDITLDDLMDLIDVGNMTEIMEAVMDVSGLKRKEQEAAEAAGSADPSTGTSSTPS